MIFLLTDFENKKAAQELTFAFQKIVRIELFEINSEVDYSSFLKNYLEVRNPRFRIIYFVSYNKINFRNLSVYSKYFSRYKTSKLNSKVLFFTRELITDFDTDWFSFIDYKDFYGNVEINNFFSSWINSYKEELERELEPYLNLNDLFRILDFSKGENLKSFKQIIDKRITDFEKIIQNQEKILERQQVIIEEQIKKSKIDDTTFTHDQLIANYTRSKFWKTEWLLIGLVSNGFIFLLNIISNSNYIFLSIAAIICVSIVITRAIQIESAILINTESYFNNNRDQNNIHQSIQHNG